MRFGGYEILRSNQWCYQVYKVTPEVFERLERLRSEIENAAAKLGDA